MPTLDQLGPEWTKVHVIQGTHAVSDDPKAVLMTILGSCVATCLWDEKSKIGGMNHFLLPDVTSGESEARLYGAHAMELLINDLMKRGARKDRLQAKLFGGASMIEGLSVIGARNAAFAKQFLSREGILCVGESLGGTHARRVRFWPVTGKAQQMCLSDVPDPVKAAPAPPAPKDVGDVSLF